MALQPDGVDQLLIGLDELNEWILTSKPNDWYEEDAGCQFLEAWCIAMKVLFEDFGPVLSKRPWEIHFLDLRRVFNNLQSFYQKYSNFMYRDSNMLLGTSKTETSLCPFQSDPRSQLHEGVQSTAWHTDRIFLLHDEKHELYFWGSINTQSCYVSLNVQHSRTGQRLRPLIEFTEARIQGLQVESCTMSPDGRFIALIYHVFTKSDHDSNSQINDSTTAGPLTVIWKINDSLDFSKRMNSRPWAGVKYSHFANEHALGPTSKGIIFVNGYCLTPSGQIATSNLNMTLPFLKVPEEQCKLYGMKADQCSFDSNGNVYLSDQTNAGLWQVMMFSPSGLNAPNLYSWDERRWRLFDVSTYGRYLIIGDMWAEEKSIHLFDTVTRKVEDLICPISNIRIGWSSKSHFSRCERKLIAFLPCALAGICIMNVIVWDDLLESKHYSRYGELPMDALIMSTFHIFVHQHGNSALLLTRDKTIQEVKLGNEVEFPGAKIVDEEYPCKLSKVSEDGLRLALLRYGPRKGYVQILQLNSAVPSRQSHLRWSDCDDPKVLAIAWSPDLSILVVDAQVFDLMAPKNDTMLDPLKIPGITELIQSRRVGLKASRYAHFRCQISLCKSFIVFVNPGAPPDGDISAIYPTDLLVFRIELRLRLVTQLQIDLPDTLSFMSVQLHPFLPLMAMCFASATEVEIRDWESELPQLHMKILNLETLVAKVIDVPDKTPEYIER